MPICGSASWAKVNSPSHLPSSALPKPRKLCCLARRKPGPPMPPRREAESYVSERDRPLQGGPFAGGGSYGACSQAVSLRLPCLATPPLCLAAARYGSLCMARYVSLCMAPYGSICLASSRYGSLCVSTSRYGSLYCSLRRLAMARYGSPRLATSFATTVYTARAKYPGETYRAAPRRVASCIEPYTIRRYANPPHDHPTSRPCTQDLEIPCTGSSGGVVLT